MPHHSEEQCLASQSRATRKTSLFLDFQFLIPVIVKKHNQLLLQWEESMKFTVLFKKVNFLKYIFI